jgi:ABC-type transporter Mla subunit MlaD
MKTMNKRLVWFTELFIWIVIIVSVVFCCAYFYINEKTKNHSYFMFFKDVDGLAKGSPVRMMGYNIGHVQDIKVYNQNIFVSFIVTEKNIYIPSGSFARVEFYGLGGSKSLEIYPSSEKTDSEKDVIIAKKPYRIDDYYKNGELINNILESIATISASSIDSFLNSGYTISNMNNITKDINNVVKSLIDDETVLMKKVRKNISKDKNSSNDINTQRGESNEK